MKSFASFCALTTLLVTMPVLSADISERPSPTSNGAQTASRRSVYVVDPDSVPFEFVEYLTEDVGLRNEYAMA